MSGLPFELLLALRYLRPKRTFVSVITLISVIGVALGVAVLIIVISVMTGFGQELRDIILRLNPHISIHESGSTLPDYRELMKQVATNKHVKGVAPLIMGPVLVEYRLENGQSARWAPNIRGFDLETEGRFSSLSTNIVHGEFDLGGRSILIGTALASRLGAGVGDRIDIYSPKHIERMKESREQGEEEVVLSDEYEVRGIFNVGFEEYNLNMIVASLENAQDMYELDDSVHAITVVLDDPQLAFPVRAQLARTLDPRLTIKTWLEDSALLSAVLVEKNVMLYILFFIVIVAAFGITCTTITFVVMKTREIGMMKAIGASNRQVMWVFMGQSLIVSVMGIITGTIGGLLLLTYRNGFLRMMRSATGMELFPADIYGFTQLPALIVPGDIVIICGGSLLICLCAAAFPAWHASRLNPVEALRYE
ncbi:MAG TPA: ABC transporter permease [Verrucomicrobiae bacterium]|nr:ABC transporter permease [Verrucomicrobiae bacterium]